MALDSGVFSDSHLIVSKAVTIEAVPGARAELRESGFSLSVNATLSDVVVLRNPAFTGDGSTFNNHIGIEARGFGNDIGIARVSHSVVTGNGTGLQVGLGVI